MRDIGQVFALVLEERFEDYNHVMVALLLCRPFVPKGVCIVQRCSYSL